MHKFEKAPETRITEVKTLKAFLEKNRSLENRTIQGIDFTDHTFDWADFRISHTTFLGCRLPLEVEVILRRKGAYIYTAPEGLPYRPFRQGLYTWHELMEGFTGEEDRSTDLRIYRHFSATKLNPSINEALWQRIHDHAIDNAIRELLTFNDDGMTRLRCVGFMGGHSTLRTDVHFQRSALTAKLLAENDFFVISGGGPGIMEAANLGAYFAGRSDQDLADALAILGKAPHYADPAYHSQAMKVLEKYPNGKESLAIPTWFYGHEPSNLFASYIAKYFSNSIREDTLLAVSLYGIVFAPGSAGTTQEIFMDATQNHYGTFNYYSPMVFLGRERYEVQTMIFPLLRQLSRDKGYGKLLYLTDVPGEVVAFLRDHPPIRVE